MAKRTDRPRSNGSKGAVCVKCVGDIQPYAGVALSAYGSKFTHHPGQCADAAERSAQLRSQAHQGELFAWSCRRVEQGTKYDDMTEVCDAGGTDRAEYVAHMKAHGETPVKPEPRIRLRRPAPAAKLTAPLVQPFKTLTWVRKTYSEWQPGIGQECTETPMRGQFWSNGADPHSVTAITYTPYRSGQRPELVTLYLRADGSVTPDWSEARQSRREGNRLVKRQAA